MVYDVSGRHGLSGSGCGADDVVITSNPRLGQLLLVLPEPSHPVRVRRCDLVLIATITHGKVTLPCVVNNTINRSTNGESLIALSVYYTEELFNTQKIVK